MSGASFLRLVLAGARRYAGLIGARPDAKLTIDRPPDEGHLRLLSDAFGILLPSSASASACSHRERRKWTGGREPGGIKPTDSAGDQLDGARGLYPFLRQRFAGRQPQDGVEVRSEGCEHRGVQRGVHDNSARQRRHRHVRHYTPPIIDWEPLQGREGISTLGPANEAGQSGVVSQFVGEALKGSHIVWRDHQTEGVGPQSQRRRDGSKIVRHYSKDLAVQFFRGAGTPAAFADWSIHYPVRPGRGTIALLSLICRLPSRSASR